MLAVAASAGFRRHFWWRPVVVVPNRGREPEAAHASTEHFLAVSSRQQPVGPCQRMGMTEAKPRALVDDRVGERHFDPAGPKLGPSGTVLTLRGRSEGQVGRELFRTVSTPTELADEFTDLSD